MKCTLMNKNKEVILTEYDLATGVFTNIYDINYAPYILKRNAIIIQKSLGNEAQRNTG